MSGLRLISARLRAMFQRRDLDREIEEELQSHLDLAAEDFERSGISPEEARRQARVKLGAIEASKDAHRDARGFAGLDGVLADIRYALRQFRAHPGFTAVAVATLAVGIGLNAAVFTVTNAVLFKGFRGVEDNDRLVYISNGGCCVPFADFEDYRAEAPSFSGLELVHGKALMFALGSELPELIDVNENTAGVFRLTGTQPLLGRDFTAEDEVPGAPRTAILHYDFWMSRFGGDPGILGRSIRLDGEPTTVIGVMPEGFSFPQRVVMWLPIQRTPEVLNRRNTNTWFAFGRLKDGATIAGARAEIDAIAARIRAADPLADQQFRPVVQRFHEFFSGTGATVIYGSMWGAVGFVLLIACANLANLYLVRGMSRAREISVRMALGAGRWRVVRQLLIESLLLSLAGAFFGWWLARLGVRAYDIAMTHRAWWLIVDYRMESGVLRYLLAISAGTAFLFGMAPALRMSRLDLNRTLKDGGRGVAGGRSNRFSSVVLGAEMALAIVLLAGAGVMIRSMWNVTASDMGINGRDLVIGNLNLPAQYATVESQQAFYERLQEKLAADGNVASATLASSLPSSFVRRAGYAVAGTPVTDANQLPRIPQMVITPGYFRTLEARLLSGRDFNPFDRRTSEPVVIVNERFAREQWPNGDPLGQHLRLFDADGEPTSVTVVGVVSNIVQNDDTRQLYPPVIYRPFRQAPQSSMWLLVRTRSAGRMQAFREAVLGLDRNLMLSGPFLLDELLGPFWVKGLYGSVFILFAVIALLLATVGLYAVIAHSVNRRTQEIGVRVALGASGGDVLGLVLHQGIRPVLIGLAVGLAMSPVINRLLAADLVGVSPSDPWTLAGAALLLLTAALFGCLIPARRALRIDPMVALRSD